MATTTQKIILSASRDIPFNKLILSQANVRRVKAGTSIDELADDIARRTLIQSLNVRPILDGEGQETGIYEVPAGGRRFRALELLVKQKRMAKTQPVPCIIRTDGLAEEDSLAENVCRVALHPLDAFRAFRALCDKGLGEEEIAARFFVTPTVVKQRLRLAAVSEKLLDIYAEDGMTLEMLMAFTVTNDHARQEQVWEALQHSHTKEPYIIRRRLTESTVRVSDKRARFVGLDTYEAAGGNVMRDLFQQDDGGWLQDPALLERLVVEKLQAEADKLRIEGWRWLAVSTEFPYGHTAGLRSLDGTTISMTDEEKTSYAALKAEYDSLEAEYSEADELPDEVDQRLGEIETLVASFDARPLIYDPADIARAGAFISINAEGDLRVERGFVRPEDETPIEVDGDLHGNPPGDDQTDAGKPAQRAVITIGGTTAAYSASEEEDDEGIKPLPDRLVGELTAHRTLALRDAVAKDPQTAFAAVLHNFVVGAFYHGNVGSCLEISLKSATLNIQAPGLKDCASAKAIEVRHAQWKRQLPKDEADLWDALIAFDGDSQAALFAHCASLSVNAICETVSRYGTGPVSANMIRRRVDDANRLGRAVNLDMVAAGWTPTVDNYLGRVTKPRILEAVREAKGEKTAQMIEHLKKLDMAREAERLFAGSGWLPEPLRTPGVEVDSLDSAAIEPTADEGIEPLPAFLAEGDEIAGQHDDSVSSLSPAAAE
jgi:ParB family transcriptional regulator, chromosome partitioning protein